MGLTLRDRLWCKTILEVADHTIYGYDIFSKLPYEIIDMLHHYLARYCDDDNLRYAEIYIHELFLKGSAQP